MEHEKGTDLARLIKAARDAGDAASLENYRRAGELLLEAKGQMSPDAWPGWLKRNFHLSERKAWEYIELAARHHMGLSRSEAK